MEAILISPDRIKIMLSEQDMEKYCLKGADISSDDAVTGMVLKKILNDVGRTVGFEGSSGRLHVQIYQSKGGCEMFVTRLPDLNGEDGFACALRFDRVLDAAMLCRRLMYSGFDTEISVYDLDGGIFVLFENEPPMYACDYGSICRAEKLSYIREYGEVLLCGCGVGDMSCGDLARKCFDNTVRK